MRVVPIFVLAILVISLAPANAKVGVFIVAHEVVKIGIWP